MASKLLAMAFNLEAMPSNSETTPGNWACFHEVYSSFAKFLGESTQECTPLKLGKPRMIVDTGYSLK